MNLDRNQSKSKDHLFTVPDHCFASALMLSYMVMMVNVFDEDEASQGAISNRPLALEKVICPTIG